MVDRRHDTDIPELVHDFDIFLSNGISLIVLRLFGVAKVPSSRVQIASDNLYNVQ